MSFNDRSINRKVLLVDILFEYLPDHLPCSIGGPTVKSIKARTPGAIFFGKISPWSPGSEYPKNTFDDIAM
jgi:hypothetical protein